MSGVVGTTLAQASKVTTKQSSPVQPQLLLVKPERRGAESEFMLESMTG